MKTTLGCAFLPLFLWTPAVPAAQGGEGDLQTLLSGAIGRGLTATGEDFSLNLRNRLQPRFTFSDLEDEANTATFGLRRPRTTFKGWAFAPELSWQIQVQWDEAVPVKDAWVDWKFVSGPESSAALRVGQQKTFFGRLASASGFDQEFVERDIATRFLANTRSRGALVHARHGEEGLFHWHLGAFNSDTAGAFPRAGEERNSIDNRLNYVLGARYDPMGDMGYMGNYESGDLDHAENLRLSFAGGLWFGNESVDVDPGPPPVTSNQIEVLNGNLSGALKVKGIHVVAEGFLRKDNVRKGPEIDTAGWNFQASYTLAPDARGHQWAVAGRVGQFLLKDSGVDTWGYAFPHLGSVRGDITEGSVGLSHYAMRHNLKTQLEWTWRNIDPDAASASDDYILHLQFTLQL